jgi:predicted transcriptional regulator
MQTAKDIMIKVIQEQPDDSSFDELLRELAFSKMIDRGLADSDKGIVVSHEEMKKRIASWQK